MDATESVYEASSSLVPSSHSLSTHYIHERGVADRVMKAVGFSLWVLVLICLVLWQSQVTRLVESIFNPLSNLTNVAGKVKVKLSLCFNRAPRHGGVLGKWRYSSTHSLTSALDGCEWSASHPGGFNPREGAPGTHWIGGWVGPRASLDVVVKRETPSPRRKSNPRTNVAGVDLKF
jgi:hypothetical protein